MRPPYPSKHAKIFFLLSNKILFVSMKYSLLLRGIFLHFKNYRNYISNLIKSPKSRIFFHFQKMFCYCFCCTFYFFNQSIKGLFPNFKTSIFDTLLIIKNFFGKRKTRGTSFNRSFWWYVILGTCTLYRVSTKYLDKITDRFVRYYYPGTYLVSTLYCLDILNMKYWWQTFKYPN